jgi:hypothetical protein
MLGRCDGSHHRDLLKILQAEAISNVSCSRRRESAGESAIRIRVTEAVGASRWRVAKVRVTVFAANLGEPAMARREARPKGKRLGQIAKAFCRSR